MASAWDPRTEGILTLPSGRLISGRGLGQRLPVAPEPEFGLYLLAHRPEPMPWPSRWLRWPDFRLPADSDDAHDALTQLWHRSLEERVEVACRGGLGRTGTALACLAVIDGVPWRNAVAYVRQHFDARAVETPWQKRYVGRFDRR